MKISDGDICMKLLLLSEPSFGKYILRWSLFYLFNRKLIIGFRKHMSYMDPLVALIGKILLANITVFVTSIIETING